MIDKHNSLAEKFLKKWFWLYLFSFIIAPIWYIIKITIAWVLEVEEIWIIYWVLSLITLVSSFNDLWMTESLNKFIPDYASKQKYSKVKTVLAYAFFTQVITWSIIFLIFYFWSGFLSNVYFKNPESLWVVKIFAFYFLWISIFQVLNTFFRAIQNTFLHKLTEFTRMLFVLIWTIFLFSTNTWNIINYSLTWVFWVYVWIIFCTIMFYIKYYRVYFKWLEYEFSKNLFKKIFKYALLIFISSQASTILSQMDMQMIIYFLWNTYAWYYTTYLSLVTIPFTLLWPIFAITLSIFSQLHANNEIEKISKAKNILSTAFIILSTSLNILFFVCSKTIATWLFWDKFIVSWIILKYSVLFLVFNFLLQINFSIMAATWKLTQRLKIILAAILFNWILNLFLIKYIWVSGPALATWLWWILIYILSEKQLKEYHLKLNYKMIWKNILLLSFLWIIINYFIIWYLDDISRIQKILWLIIIWICYYLVFAVFNFWDFKKLLWEIKILKKKKVSN